MCSFKDFIHLRTVGTIGQMENQEFNVPEADRCIINTHVFSINRKQDGYLIISGYVQYKKIDPRTAIIKLSDCVIENTYTAQTILGINTSGKYNKTASSFNDTLQRSKYKDCNVGDSYPIFITPDFKLATELFNKLCKEADEAILECLHQLKDKVDERIKEMQTLAYNIHIEINKRTNGDK